jgi:hypothetical protein
MTETDPASKMLFFKAYQWTMSRSSVHRKTVFTYIMNFETLFLKNSFLKLPTFPFVLLTNGCPHNVSPSTEVCL